MFRIDISRMAFDVFLAIAFLLAGLVYASTCDIAETATSIAANSICVAVALLIATNCSRDRKRDVSMRRFTLLAWTTLGYIMADLLGWIMLEEQSPSPLQYIADAGEVLIGYLMTIMFTRYVREFVGPEHRWMRPIYRVLSCLCVLFALGFLITLPMGLPFKIIDRVYVRGSLYALFQAYPIIAVIANLLIITLSHRFTPYEKLSLSTYCLAPLVAVPAQFLHYGVAATSVSLLISLVIIYNTIYMRHSEMLAQQDQELTQSRVNMMVSQIQPHFLYNTLTSIANICEKDPKTARRAIVDFSDYLRVNLDSLKCNRAVPFEKELEHCKTYLSFEKMRFEEDLTVEYDIRAFDFTIPILSIQPLLENAVKHGICNKPDGGTVRLATYRWDGRIYIEITDNGIGFDPSAVPHNDSRQHIGLDNVRYRIQQMCDGEMTVESTPGEGTKVTISLPEKDGDNS